LVFVWLGAFGSCARPAFAQVDKSSAVALFDQAEALMRQGKYLEACDKYEESNRLDPQLGVLLHLAECREKVGQYASAWATFRDAAELADRRADARSLAARERADALESKLSRLTIFVPETAVVEGMRVLRDGVAVRAPLWGVPVPVDPGEHVVDVTAPGKIGWRGTVTVSAASTTASINVPVLADAPIPVAPAQAGSKPVEPVDRAPGDPGATQRLLGWIGVGAGAAGVVTGVVFHVQSASKLNERDDLCPDDVCENEAQARRIEDLTDEANTSATVGTVALVAGGLLAAGGVTLVLTAPAEEQRAILTPHIAPGYAGLTLFRSW
jgi:tetratricopeptide (TPR) repeat protein